MNVHEQMESLTDLYVAGGLPADERGEVDRHIAECKSCAALLKDAREFASWAKGLIKNDAPPADLEDRVIARFRAAGQSKKRRFPVGNRFFKVTGSIAAAVALIFIGNAATDGPAEGYMAEVRSRLVAQSGVQEGEGKVRTLSSGDGDFRANGREWAYLGWHSGGKGINGAYVEDGDKLARSNEFTTFFGRDLGGERGVDVLSRANAGIAGRIVQNGDELALRRLGELKTIDVVTDGVQLGLVSPSQGGGAPMERTVNPSFAIEAEKLAKLTAEPLAETRMDKAAKVDDAKADARPANLAGKPQIATAAVALEEAKVEPTPVVPKPTMPVQDNRKIIRTAEVSVEVDSYDATYTKLTELMTAEKGMVASANTNKAANGKISATVVLRIPPERFEAVLAKLKDFGTIRNQNVDSEDVTKAYIDLETRLKSKEILAERLKKLLAEGKGTVKELMEVEVQLGNTNEAIESIKGEIKYYDNRIGLSTLTLQIAEKDLGQPFEYVQTLQANLALTSRDPDDAYAKAQKEIADAGGQVVDSRMTRQNDGSSTGYIRGRVDADKFQALRDSLKKLGVPTNDTVNQQKTARGGHQGAPKPDAPLRKEQAVLDLTISSPPIFVTRRSQILVETATVDTAYQASRKAVEAAGGKIVDGNLTGRVDGMQATLRIQIDADKFQALVDSLKTAGKVKNANVNSVLPAASTDGTAPLLRERAEIDFALVTPPQLIGEEHGLWKSVQDTFAKSWAGFLWSIEKLFVGISLAGPWVLLAVVGIVIWRKRRKAVSNP